MFGMDDKGNVDGEISFDDPQCLNSLLIIGSTFPKKGEIYPYFGGKTSYIQEIRCMIGDPNGLNGYLIIDEKSKSYKLYL